MQHDMALGSTYTPLSTVHPELQDVTSKLQLNTKIISAIGSLSVVYRCSCADSTKVAVKAIVLPTYFSPAEKEVFARKVRREFGIWKRIEHPNIVPLLGVASSTDFGSEYPCIVSTWMTNGTLNEYIKQPKDELSFCNRVELIKGIAVGLEYLHSKGIIHGDLHPANILIDDNHVPRLTDLGLSQTLLRPTDQLAYLYTTSMRAGAMLWAAPELLYPELYPKLKPEAMLRNDIYSLGSIILFILSAQYPWKDRGEAQNKFKEFQNPPRPASVNIPDPVWDYIERCWSPQDPESRPSAQDALSFCADTLEQLLLPKGVDVLAPPPDFAHL